MKSRRILYGIIGLIILLIVVMYIREIKSPEEEIMEACLYNLCNITDPDEVDVINEKLKELISNINSEATGVVSLDSPELIEFISFGYDTMCTEHGLNTIVTNNLHFFHREGAKLGQFTVEVKDIDFTKKFSIEKNGTVLQKDSKVGYEYIVELQIDYVNSDKQETIFEEGHMNLMEVNGEWKVDLLEYKTLNEIFRNYDM